MKTKSYEVLLEEISRKLDRLLEGQLELINDVREMNREAEKRIKASKGLF